MRPTSFPVRLIRGIRRHPSEWFARVAASLSFSWAAFEYVGDLCPAFAENITLKLAIGLVVLLAATAWSAMPATAKVRIGGTNTTVSISVGDLLEFAGHKVVAVNEFFDSHLGDCVSKDSLHGQVILKFFQGDESRFEQDVDTALAIRCFTYDAIDRKVGRHNRYAIGTTAILDVGEYRLFLAALSRTNVETLKATASITDLMHVMHRIWQDVRTFGNGRPVALPLIGSGLSGINLPPSGLLSLILLSLSEQIRSGEITKDIHILLTEDTFARIDSKRLLKELLA